jgi:hypothetical protein
MLEPRCGVGWLLFAGCLVTGWQTAAAADVDYLKQVKPLLEARCYACHGALKQKGGLRLDTAALAIQGGDSGPAVVAGDPAKSELIGRVTAKGDERMPPEHEGEPLTAAQVDLLRKWVAAGALHPADEKPEADPRDHWAFKPVGRPPVPTPKAVDWVNNPVDAFVARRHEDRGLTPLPGAPRAVLLRRLSLDLIGLPPTLEEIAAFQADGRKDWYERAVNRLLDDPRHGERWARHWMDVWRYSDWWGLGNELRNSQKHMWHWRDWIVEAVNKDAPYDEMVRQMLAADELYPTDPDKLRATGFLARNYFLFNRHQWMDETVEHVGKAFLGLTMNCVRCHDHKYDPIPQADYYRLRAFFEPYHARLDMVPGELDLERNGIPRVFDARPDEPTYRFVRGDEKNPDKSRTIAPGVPAFLAPKLPDIKPVELPVEAWQPQRRAWVIDGYIAAAKQKVTTAEAALAAAEKRLAELKAFAISKAEPAKSPGDKQEGAAKPPVSVDAAEAEQQVAKAAVAVARAELTAVELRAKAWQLVWVDRDENQRRAAHTAAIKVDREAAVARARQAVAAAERDVKRSAKENPAAAKAVQTAKDALDKATAAVAAEVKPTDKVSEFVGGRWTPTRFLSSGADDPAPPFTPRSTGRRTALAKWVTDPRNTLTARVAANHIWTRHFGTPLVPTVFDFGRKGQPPTHPELLDWLAAELVESGWSMKHLHRLIVTSATYRLASAGRDAEANAATDPDNVHLWRRTPVRLESQAVRDSLLSLADALDPKMGGPSVLPAQQADSKRRSLYFFHSNNERNLFLTTFDEALVTDCYRREQSIVPQQALAMTNSRLVLDLSRPIADRVTNHLAASGRPADDETFTRAAFLLLLAAEPSDKELAACSRGLGEWRKLPEAGSGATAAAFARANLVWVLLNHNDFVTVR